MNDLLPYLTAFVLFALGGIVFDWWQSTTGR